jgi:phosphohistidine phosphatase
LKTVFLIRHAKSDWADSSLNDFDRPLNERGKRDAPLMAQHLLDKKINIDLFVSSPAKRARKTAEIFVKEFGREKETIFFHESLYLASAPVFFDMISKTNDSVNSIAVFSHNPGITDFANLLTHARIDDIPTCGIFAVKIKADSWKEFEEAEKEFWFFDYPKAIK